MNVKALSSMLDQQLRPDNKSSSKTSENTENKFGQLLQGFTAKTNEQSTPSEDLLTINTGAFWLQLLLTPFGQQIDEQLSTPDLTLSLNTGEQEEGSTEEMMSASLTEIMAALQPLISQSNVPLLSQPSSNSDEMAHFSLAVTNDTIKANATSLLGLLPVTQQAEGVLDLPAEADEAEQLLNTIDALLTQTQPNSVATDSASSNSLQSQAAVAGNLQTARMVDISSVPNVIVADSISAVSDIDTPLANDQPPPITGELPPHPQTSIPTRLPSQPHVSTPTELPSQPHVSTPAELPIITPQSAIAPVTTPLPGPQLANVETTATFQLPNIPALHQITDSVGVLTRQGQTEVRLHLQPETLGHLWVKLHITHGNVAVQMLAETPQAQALIQDHLAQLKIAFAARGLQIDGLSVAVGQDNSAFNLPDRRSNSDPNRSNRHQSNSSLYELDQATASRPITNLWGSLRTVDYQV